MDKYFKRRLPYYFDDSDYQTNAPSYYDDLARKQKLIKLLSKRIWEYENTLDETLEQIETRLTDYITENDNLMNERLENWDQRIDEMPEEMRSLFVTWLNDGTLEQIINHDVLGNKADKSFVDTEIERLDQADEDIITQLIQTETNLRKDIEQHGFDLRWNEHLVVDGDWTQALQQALDDSPDDGRTIFIGQDIRIDTTIIWPHISGDTGVNKPCTIQGMAKNRGNGVITGYQKGEVAIEFTGDGALFDLRNGSDSQTNSSVSFRDINLFGQDKEGSIGIHAEALRGANFENMQFRRFDVGMHARGVYYATFDNLRFFYNLTYGLNVEGEVNHTKFHRCNFSQTIDGTGVRVSYGQTGVVFDGCWFEGNQNGLSLQYCMQALIQGCYFEENHNTISISGHIETGQTTVTIIGSNITTFEDSRNFPIYMSGTVSYNISLIGNTIFHEHSSGIIIGGSGRREVVSINNHTGEAIVDYPANLVLEVSENGVYTKQVHGGMQVGGDVTQTAKTAKMEVFNRNGDSAGWVQLYEG